MDEVSFGFALLGGFIVGALLGLVPWVVGNVRGNKILGTVCFVIILITGMLFGILGAGPLTIIATVVCSFKWTEE